MQLSDFPALNASLNGLTTCLLLAGYWFIRRQATLLHILCMVLALISSTVFLSCYIYYHFHAGRTEFTAQGIIRPVYFTILISHTILAVAILPLVLTTVIQATRRRWRSHVRWARITLPLWLYVSITGVLIYFILYQWFPPA